MKCPKCGKDNIGYRKVREGLWRFSDCGCAIPTIQSIGIEAGMHPEAKQGATP